MYEDELDRLEIRISYLEKQNEELNEVVIEQSKTITHLMVQMEEIKKKVKDLINSQLVWKVLMETLFSLVIGLISI